jgi:5-methylcytosine-specific restriction endonuclease McrBC regulatory subunit McrC
MFLGGGFLTHHFIIDDGAISNYHILTPYTMNTSSTLHRALKGLDKQLKNELVALKRMLSDIDQIELTNLLFKQVRLNRNNRFYGFVMNVCQIIMKALSHRKSKENTNFRTSLRTIAK